MTLQKKNKVKGNNVEKAAGLEGHEMSESLKFNRENYKYFRRYCGKIATRNKTQERIQKNCPPHKKKKKKLNLIGALTRNVLHFRRRNGNKSRKQKDGK